MKTKISIAAVLLMAISLQSCGVMFGGSKYNATIIATNHPNAQIYVGGKNIGTGTAKGTYKRDEKLTVEVREEGCEPKVQTFDNIFRTGNFILSVVGFGLVGVAVDLGTGAAYKPDHRHNKAITKNSTKNFTFNVETGCKTE